MKPAGLGTAKKHLRDDGIPILRALRVRRKLEQDDEMKALHAWHRIAQMAADWVVWSQRRLGGGGQHSFITVVAYELHPPTCWGPFVVHANHPQAHYTISRMAEVLVCGLFRSIGSGKILAYFWLLVALLTDHL